MACADELASWDAVETAARIRAGDVSASEVLDAAIARAEAARPLGAIVTETFDRARRTGRPAGALAGVPTFIKDLSQVRGVRTRWGSAASGDYTSRRSDPSVERLEAIGLVSLGKSATPELGLTATTEALCAPPCRNPWAPARSSGGSSGGAAALVAAGVVPIAHANDGGGSIRIPAAACGLVGLKVSRGRLDMEGSNLLPVNIAVHGCVSRTVRDTIAFWEAIEPRGRRRATPIGRVTAPPNAPLRIGAFVAAPLGTPVDAACRAAVRATGLVLETLGHRVEEIACPFDGSVGEDFLRYWGFLAWVQARGGRVLIHRGFDAAQLEPWTLGLVRHFTSDLRAGLGAVRRMAAFGRRYAAIMERFDVLLCPTLASPAPGLGYLAPDLPFETAWQRILEYVPFTPPINAAGAPAISLPLARTPDDLPIGVQLSAAPGRDARLLELALGLEEAQGWPRAAPRARWAEGAEARR